MEESFDGAHTACRPARGGLYSVCDVTVFSPAFEHLSLATERDRSGRSLTSSKDADVGCRDAAPLTSRAESDG